MKKILKNTSLLCLIYGVAATSSFNVMAKSPENYQDINSIVGSDADSLISQELGIIYPKKVTKTTTDTFYIAGTSDPAQPLYMNDSEIKDRAENGIFEVTISLPQDGAYSCVFRQGDKTKVVPIFKNVEANESYNGFSIPNVVYKKTSLINSTIYPSQNVILTDKLIKLQCSGPAGASVTADFCGSTFSLNQENKSTALGVAAKYSTTVNLSNMLDDDKTYDLGNVIYKLNYQGNIIETPSSGRVYFSKSRPPYVRVSWQYARLRKDTNENDSNILSVLKKGVIDRVINESGDYYQLGCGGYVSKQLLEPIFNETDIINNISQARFAQDDKCEKIILEGTACPVFTSGLGNNKLIVRLYNTKGNVDLSTLSQVSSIFDEVNSKNENDCLEITFNLKGSNILFGYNIEFDENNNTVIYLKKRPHLSEDPYKPLQGITVVIDAGHGGSDPGALGIMGEIGGPVEKDINLINNLATKRRLESLGATVVMTRQDDRYVSLSDRAEIIEKTKPDFVVVEHANASAQGTASNGIIIFYTNDNKESYPFSNLIANISSSYTERRNGGTKIKDFYIAKNTFCPTAYCEVGFLTNISDAASLFSKEKIFDFANSVSDSIIKYLSNNN